MFYKFIQVPQVQGTADIFRGIMVSLYVKGKENGHVQAYAPYRSYGSEAMGWPYEQARRPPHRFRPTPLVASLSMTKIAIA